ncbi:MAG: hypothetical protein JJT89_00995 [Nitriliruptoraceae bacterium]|nr:hypothetical protein [Nitriliruptoraceae bacterium]
MATADEAPSAGSGATSTRCGPYAAFGRQWEVATDDPELAELVRDTSADMAADPDADVPLARFELRAPDGDHAGVVLRDGAIIGGSTSLSVCFRTLVWGINRWVLDRAGHEHVLLHAGGVVDGDGAAVVLPGPSGTGKSTLTTGLLDRGLHYLSEEAVALDEDGTVRGYPRPLAIDQGAWEVHAQHTPNRSPRQTSYLEGQWHIRPSSLAPVAERGRLVALVFPRYEEQAETRLELLGPSQALIEATNATFGADGSDRVELWKVQRLARLLSDRPAFRLVSGDLDAACRAVLDVFEELAPA